MGVDYWALSGSNCHGAPVVVPISVDCFCTSTKWTFCHFPKSCFDFCIFWTKNRIERYWTFEVSEVFSTILQRGMIICTSKFKLEKLQTVVKGVLIPKFTQILKGRGETIRAG